MSLREVLKSRRKTLAVSQQDLAEMAGVGVATVKDIERGKVNPTFSWNSACRCNRRQSINY